MLTVCPGHLKRKIKMNVEVSNCSAVPNKNEIRFSLNVVVEPIELILFP